MDCALSCPASGHGACSGVWLLDPVSLHQRKLVFHFPSGYQLQIVSELWRGLCVFFLYQYWDFVRFEPVWVLCMLCWSLWVHICICLVSGRCYFLKVIYHHWHLMIFLLSLLNRCLNVGGKRLIKTSYLRLSWKPNFKTKLNIHSFQTTFIPLRT